MDHFLLAVCRLYVLFIEGVEGDQRYSILINGNIVHRLLYEERRDLRLPKLERFVPEKRPWLISADVHDVNVISVLDARFERHN